MSRTKAERRAITAFGSPQQVAEDFGIEARSVLGRTAAAVSDFSYRVARNPQALTGFAGAVVIGALSCLIQL